LPDDEYYNLTRTLNERQQHVFQFALDWCRAKRQSDDVRRFICIALAALAQAKVT